MKKPCLMTLALLLGATFFFGECSYASPDIPSDNLAYPVLLLGENNNAGSGFFYNTDDAVYLVTARHVLFKGTTVFVPGQVSVPRSLRHKFDAIENKLREGIDLAIYGVMSQEDKDEILRANPKRHDDKLKEAVEELYKNSQELKLVSDKVVLRSSIASRFGGNGINEIALSLPQLLLDKQIRYHPSHDIAYVKIGTVRRVNGQEQVDLISGVTKKSGAGIIGVAKDNIKLLKDVIVGNQVIIFGYPLSITAKNPWLEIGLPLLRSGVVAGINNELNAIILDCPVFQGNSGGLVMELETVSINEVRYRAIGVVTHLVPYRMDWVENSGYSVVVPMDFIKQLLEQEKSSPTH